MAETMSVILYTVQESAGVKIVVIQDTNTPTSHDKPVRITGDRQSCLVCISFVLLMYFTCSVTTHYCTFFFSCRYCFWPLVMFVEMTEPSARVGLVTWPYILPSSELVIHLEAMVGGEYSNYFRAQFGGVRAFGYNSADSEPILMKSRAL